MVYALVDKSVLFADKAHHKENLKKIKKILVDNYPPQFVSQHILEWEKGREKQLVTWVDTAYCQIREI